MILSASCRLNPREGVNLRRCSNDVLGDDALRRAGITLLVASSDPTEKYLIVSLIVMMLEMEP